MSVNSSFDSHTSHNSHSHQAGYYSDRADRGYLSDHSAR